MLSIREILAAVCVVSALTYGQAASGARETLDIQSPTSRACYAIGMDIGRSVVGMSEDLHFDVDEAVGIDGSPHRVDSVLKVAGDRVGRPSGTRQGRSRDCRSETGRRLRPLETLARSCGAAYRFHLKPTEWQATGRLRPIHPQADPGSHAPTYRRLERPDPLRLRPHRARFRRLRAERVRSVGAAIRSRLQEQGSEELRRQHQLGHPAAQSAPRLQPTARALGP